jgi:hypothetical protein
MGKKGYLGIDESNNGRFPEIFVAVYSEDEADITHHDRGLSKKRNRLGDSISSILKGREYLYVMAGEEYGRAFPMPNISVIACSELINSFGDLELVIIDGLPGVQYMKKLESMIKCGTQIKTAAKGDTTYPIVNLADRIAHKLYKYHSEAKRRNNDGNDYQDSLIIPGIEDYASLYKTEKDEKSHRQKEPFIKNAAVALQKIA